MPDRHFHPFTPPQRPNFWFIVGLILFTGSASLVPAVFAADDTIPKGFTPERYARLWERNPFTLVTPVMAQGHASAFDKLVLVSWSQDGSHEVVFVQNSDTNDVQKVSDAPNAQGLRLIEVHRNANLQAVEAILANSTEQGPVRFRTEAPAAAPGAGFAGPSAPGDQTGAVVPGLSPPMPAPQPPVPNTGAFNAATQANQRMNGGPTRPNNQPNVPRMPTASDYRRRRVLPTPNTNLQPQVNPQPPANPNRENQD